MRLPFPLIRVIPGAPAGKLARWRAILPKIADLEAGLRHADDHELRRASLSLRHRAKCQEPLDRLLPDAFALVREAARRTLGMRHFEVQLLGAIAMHHGAIVEMQTGEGKTVAATPTVYLNALTGRGTHLATANPYLARRDAEWMGPIYALLGMTVGVVVPDMSQDERREAYACDVTYGTGTEFGFDFLRDRLLLRAMDEGRGDVLGAMLGDAAGPGDRPVQREPHFVVVDEADGILIDAANTPLIIGTPAHESQRTAAECFHWAARNAAQFKDQVHYTYDHKKKSVELSSAGRRLARTLSKPDALDSVGTFPTYEYVERAIKVERAFVRDQQYVVRDGEVVVVDEYSGRLSEGVKWSDGIHEAVEAKEQIPVHVQPGHSARVTIQDFFMRYPKLAGMTGTAVTSASELRRIYKVHVAAVPPNRPVVRERLPTRIFGDKQRKWEAIVAEAAGLASQGRPVLIGTRSIDKSQELSCLLAAANIEHQVLNARQVDREAAIVAAAGGRGKVTVSTNMAGRGTDIKLGNGVAELGGLHVILTELHEAARIDRQLIGRCGRQGDPGSFRQFLALDDEILLAGLGAEQAEFLADFGKSSTGPFDYTEWLFLKAQRALERRHFRGRRWLMHHEKERKKLNKQMGQDPYLD